MKNKKSTFTKVGRVLLWILVSVFILIIAAYFFINVPLGRKLVRNQVENYLEKKLKTKVDIGYIDYSLPKWLKLKNVYIEDQRKDTLLFGEELSVDLDMLKLLQGNTDIHKVYFKNMMINVNRPEKDSFFNYQFVVNAFTGNKSTTAVKDTAELKLTLERLIFDNVGLKFRDDFLGNNFTASIKNLDVTNNRFQPDRVNFGIDNFYAKGVKFHMNTLKNSADSVKEFSATDTLKKTPYELLISAKRVTLRDVDVIVDNKVTDLYYSNNITNLSGTNVLYSISKARGTADSLLLDSTAIVFSSAKKKTTSKQTSSSVPWVFAAKQLNINNTAIKYNDINKPAGSGLDFAHFDAKNLNAAINGFHYSKDSTTALVSQFAFNDKSGFVLDTTHMKFLMSDKIISAQELYFKTPRSLLQNFFELKFDSAADISRRPQNSLISAKLNGTTIAFNDLYMLLPSMAKPFPKAQFANQYLALNTELRGTLQRMYLPYLELRGLSGSRISARGTLYNIADPLRLSYDLFIINSSILKKDIFRFVPPANQKMFASLPSLINLRGSIKGIKNDLAGNINLSGKDLAFAGKINLTNISDPAKMKYGFDFKSATLSRDFIAGFLPPAILKQVNLPSSFTAVGKFGGTKESIITDMKLSTSYGPLYIKGFLKNLQDPLRINYDLDIKTSGFALGKLIKQDTVIGNIAGAFTMKGTGFDYKTMNSVVKADIASLQYNKYNYQNARINADFAGGNIRSKGDINDPALKFNYVMDGNFRGTYPIVHLNARIDTAQLNALHFTKDTLNFSGTVKLDAENLQPRNLNASLFIDDLKFQSGKNVYRIDTTTSLVASSLNGIDSIVFNAPFADVHAGGAFDYDKIGESLLQYVNNFYKLPGYKPTAVNIPDQQFAVKGIIRQSPIVTGFIPGLNKYDDIKFAGSYSSAYGDSALIFNASIPQLSYATNKVTNGSVNINSKNGQLNYRIKFDTLKTAGNLLYGTLAEGAAAKDSLSLHVATQDNKNKKWFELAGTGFVKNEEYTFRLQDTLMLNYERWAVQTGNYIQYSPKGIIINQFRINNDTSRISLNSKQLIPDSPIDIDIANFNLKSISTLINKDTVLVAGILDMKATVSDLKKPLPSFTGTGSVTNLQYMQHPLGNITASAQKQTDNNISAEINLIGYGNDINAKGNYYLNNTNQQFDADLQVKQLNFRTLEAFSAGQVKNSSGNISGNINLTGKFADPRWNGQLNFDTVQFTLTQLGTPYKIDKQKIVLNYPDISFPQFIVKDSLNNDLKINGKITSKSLTAYDLDVDINANDFILVNAKKAVSSQVYGFAAVDVNVSVSGSSAKPDIEGDISLNDKSDVKIVLPQTGYEKNDGKTIVRFIDRDTFDINPPTLAFEPEQKAISEFAQFLNYNLNIELTKEAAITILIDPSTGDEIKVQGDAKLNAGVDPGGNLVLAGVYELDKGYYDLHYGFLQRKFNLIKGSTITFAGTPVNAEANITAEYIAYTSSKELLTNEITDVTPTLANSFRQKLPFRVILYLTGPLNKPDIKFDIQLPEQSGLLSNDLNTTIENKLQQIRSDPALINKQIFSLLLLNRFVSEQSSDFFKGNGGDFNDLARQSVSQFLSSALNEIASDLFKGIDVDLNLNSYNDFSNGGNTARTDLNVAVSKTFANDRIVVSVGKNFGVEGQDAAAKVSGTNTGFKPDITLTYKLTPDGRYLLRAYTKNQFEVTLDGYVVETGLAFQVSMDYDKFRELFRKKVRTKK